MSQGRCAVFREPIGPTGVQVTQIAQVTGLSLKTIRKGIAELRGATPPAEALAPGRSRRPGGGRKKVEVVNYPDARFAVQFNGTALGFKVFDKIQTVQPGAIVDNKRLSAVLEQIKAQQAAYPARQQRGHVARQRPPNNLEAPGLPSKGRAPRHSAAAARA